jgi:glycogen synthase
MFNDLNAGRLDAAPRRVLVVYGQPAAWRRVRSTAVARRHAWDVAAASSATLYRAMSPGAATATG